MYFRLYPEYDQALNNLGNLLKVRGYVLVCFALMSHRIIKIILSRS